MNPHCHKGAYEHSCWCLKLGHQCNTERHGKRWVLICPCSKVRQMLYHFRHTVPTTSRGIRDNVKARRYLEYYWKLMALAKIISSKGILILLPKGSYLLFFLRGGQWYPLWWVWGVRLPGGNPQGHSPHGSSDHIHIGDFPWSHLAQCGWHTS